MEKRFFCIRGFMKSGTNWLGSLLSSHRSISCVGEFHWQNHILARNEALRGIPIYLEDERLASQFRERFEAMVKQMLESAADPKATHIGDRTPHTIEPVVLRGVPHICIIRDGRDMLVSRAFHLYNQPQSHRLFERIPELHQTLKRFQADPWFFKKNPEQLLGCETMVRESATWWRQHLESDRAAVGKYPNLPIRFVRYEDLHADVEGERRKLFEFLGVAPKKASPIEGNLKPGFGKERPNEFLRKGAVGDWKNYFSDETKQWFKESAGDELVTQRYVQNDAW